MSALIKIQFHDDTLEVTQDGEWIALRRACENIGLDADTQRRKLADKAWATTVMMTVVAADGKSREQVMLHRDSLPMWLATIDAERVEEEMRPKIELYQRECARVLRDHFFGKRDDLAKREVIAAPRPRWSPAEIMRLGRMGEKMLAELGVAKDIAAAATLELVRTNTGVDMEAIRKALPGRPVAPEWLNPTQVGEVLGLSAREVNKLLEQCGLQTRDGGAWRITEAGKAYGEAKPFNRNGHTGFQVMWRPLVIAVLEAARAEKPAGDTQ